MDSPHSSREGERIHLQEFTHGDDNGCTEEAEVDIAPDNQSVQSPIPSTRSASPNFNPHQDSLSSTSLDSFSNGNKTLSPAWLRKILDNITPSYWTRKKEVYEWRVGCFLGCVMAFAVLCTNIGLLVAGARTEEGFKSGFATLSTGSSSHISKLSTFYHVLINVLSTILLSASNYVMQIMSNPTREDLDKAHQSGDWLDVGVLSLRNIVRFPKRRRIVFLILCISSAPLHLFYNAAIFKVIRENSYQIEYIPETSQRNQELERNTLSNLTENWQSIYGVENPSGYANLSLVFDYLLFTTKYQEQENRSELAGDITLPFVHFPYVSDIPYSDLQALRIETKDFPEDYNWIDLKVVKYYGRGESARRVVKFSANAVLRVIEAWGQRTEDSSLRVSLLFMLIVITFNAFKLITMLYVLLFDRHPRLVTVGDGIASFLENPDVYTSGYCTISVDEYLWRLRVQKRRHENRIIDEKIMKRIDGYWDIHRKRKGAAVLRMPIMMLVISMTISAGAIVAAMCMLFSDAPENGLSWGTSSTTGFSLSANPFISKGMLLNALVANTPQLILSAGYLLFNGFYTSMAIVGEYNDFSIQRKALRVSQPRGQQRSTYFLQLPYKWAIPLNTAAAALHWLLSQAIFFTRIDKMGSDGKLKREVSVSACNYSVRSSILLLFVISVLVAAATGVGLMRFKARMPYASSCSWVISAACHPPPEEVEPHLKRVKWGVVQSETYSIKGVPHCSFSSRHVRAPEPDVRYE
ncbi:hypothetical protein HDK90DRAFT_125707 [Phyllosticta capitalensis]|uniref:DUF6536 domain-containing protein n=1 Tax=Phyllosticta capitalensis TaxID=121624 RepID=A0ABR1YXU1_9PEZI